MTQSGRVLVIDDDSATCELVSEVLALEGYECLTAQNAPSALEMLGQMPFNLILLDVHMPLMKGPEFVSSYQQTPAPHAPIVVMSGDRQDRIGPLSVSGYLRKPFTIDELLTIARQHSQVCQA